MSGILGQILGNVLGGSGQVGQPSALSGILQQVLAGGGTGAAGGAGAGGTGLQALLSRLQTAGLGGQAQSWVGTGQNQPVSAGDVSRVFSPAEIEGWAQRAGTTPEAMRQVLAEALPHAVDHVTPNGQMPAQTADIGSLLSRFVGGGSGFRA